MDRTNKNMHLPLFVQQALMALGNAGFEGYVVGGAVRDYLRGASAHDWDIATNALPQQTKEVFSAHHIVCIGEEYGTVQVQLDGQTLEITTYRKDGPYIDARHPEEVSFTGDIIADLSRRDFTMNAVAYNPAVGYVDPFGGMEDIKAGVLRCVGEPRVRFAEDALRILRAVRFAAQLGFSVESETANAMQAGQALLAGVSAQRIYAELEKAVCGAHTVPAFLRFGTVLAAVVPEIGQTLGFAQNSIYHKYDVWQHSVESLGIVQPKTPLLCFATLLHDIAKPACCTQGEDGHRHFRGHPEMGAQMVWEILTRLQMPVALKKQVSTLVLLHDTPLANTRDAVSEIVVKHGVAFMQALLQVKIADTLTHAPAAINRRMAEIQRAQTYLEEAIASGRCFTLQELAVNGVDMLAIGFEGAGVGAVLHALLVEVARGEMENEREVLLAYAKEQL
ncbi:CCA tRNA nucleotidyltransferase [Ruminococcaceae bacterium OttesenSCG-928-N02]|nr:CCA tRNA nucleotidyltransferase [Ruminococcaceae bacterium OttesenSCG-928-N02]